MQQDSSLSNTNSCVHPPAVSADGVYLAVVRQQTERLREAPCGECVGREARVDQCESAREVVVRQVRDFLRLMEFRLLL